MLSDQEYQMRDDLVRAASAQMEAEGIHQEEIGREKFLALAVDRVIRAKLKRLCPYVGSDIPDSVRQKAREMWPAPRDPDRDACWQWDGGSGDWQWELELCDMDDSDVIDPAGYVAIRPVAQSEYALFFVLRSWELDGCDRCPRTFQSVQEAKRYLDTLLAADTPTGCRSVCSGTLSILPP